jgi:hypothetical protein
MLERLALDLTAASEAALIAGAYGLAVLGFIVALLWRRDPPDQLARAPYFALSSLLILLASAVSLVWLWTLEALANGILWVLVAVTMAAMLVLGFLFGRLAAARSRNAYGSQAMAFLGMIPLLNLVLLFYPPQDGHATASRAAALKGPGGVVLGLVLLGSSVALDRWIENRIEQLAAQAEADPSGAVQEAMIEAQGIEEVLRIVAEQSQPLLPAVIDEATTLVSVEAIGPVLRRTFVITLEISWTDELGKEVAATLCGDNVLRSFLRGGATLEEVYVDKQRSPLKTYAVSEASCT